MSVDFLYKKAERCSIVILLTLNRYLPFKEASVLPGENAWILGLEIKTDHHCGEETYRVFSAYLAEKTLKKSLPSIVLTGRYFHLCIHCTKFNVFVF